MLSTQATTIVVHEPISASINYILHGVGGNLNIAIYTGNITFTNDNLLSSY